MLARYLLGGALLFTSGLAHAITQPNGQTVPVDGSLLSAFINGSPNNDNIDEGIDVVAEAAVQPETFGPQCEFSGKYIAKGGDANFAVGWYNVDPARPDMMPPLYVPVDLGANLNTAAANSAIQILFPFSSTLPPPAMRDLTSVSIRESPAYLGGLIGFVLVPNPNGTGSPNATQYHYTEHRFNVRCTQCTTPGPWYSDLIYKSKMIPNTFYLGFEDLDFMDLPGDQGVNGNDLDYEDFLFRFTGLACATAGQPCQVVGNLGVCANGVSDCDAQGNATCTASIEPGSEVEVCDGLDNDCNDLIDDSAICPAGEVCDRGKCVAPCGSGEFPCATGFACEQMVCVEAACVGVTCPAGEVCHGGNCTAPCAGVVCPVGQVCIGDHCLDTCAGITCNQGQVCVSGVCVTSCACRTCPTGESCVEATGACVESACATVTCDAGAVCKDGECIDPCDGAQCPAGELCQDGQCVTQPPTTASSSASGMFAGSGGAGGASATSGSGGSGEGSGGNESGCGCRLEAQEISSRGVALTALAVGLAIGARRRRRSTRRRA